jgi:lysozyme family protein
MSTTTGARSVAPAVGASMTPRSFIAGFIDAHEGGLSLDPKDNGNWFDVAVYRAGGRQRAGVGRLIGSKFGVTAAAIALYRGTTAITPGIMAALTRAEAIDIGVELYFARPGFGLLPWNRVTASILDKAWGSGQETAVKLVQRMLGVADDGALGPVTAAAYRDWLARLGEEAASRVWANVRLAFDKSLNQSRYLKGWNNRTLSMLPGTAWWRKWSVA